MLTMNRPERRNALSDQMLAALGATLAQVEADDAVGAVVLTGAGGAFCAGGDVKGFAERTPGAPGASAERQQRANQRATSGRLWRMPKPTVAVLPGPAAGAGLSLALACDLRYAASSAVLTTAFARVALAGDYGSAWFLVRLVGPARARELLYLSPRLSADDALRWGLVNAVVPPDALEREAMAVARRLADGPRTALASMKENVALALTHPARGVHGRRGDPPPGDVRHRRPRGGRTGLRREAGTGLRRTAKRPAPVIGPDAWSHHDDAFDRCNRHPDRRRRRRHAHPAGPALSHRS